MKKLVLSIVMVVGFAAAVIAQPRAIGGRVGWALEASYQHGFGTSRFLEIDAGFYGFDGVQGAVVHDWIFASPSWTPKGTWDWYAGVGGAVGGYGFLDIFEKRPNCGYVGVAGQIGLSYTFWFPLQLSADFRPTIGTWFNRDQVGFYYLGAWDFALSVRYAFGVR